MVYLIAVVLTIFGIIINSKIPSNTRKAIFIIIVFYTIVIVALRFRVGSDTLMYMRDFRGARPLDIFFDPATFEKSRYEPGYLLVCAICKSFTYDFWPVQLIMATITNVGVGIFIWRYSKNIFLSFLLYLVFLWLYFSTEIMRESAAIGIFLINFKNFEEKKWVKYYLFSLLSISFHFSAIIILFFPLVKFLKPNLLFFATCIGFLCITPLVESLNSLLTFVSIANRVDYYSSTADDVNIYWRIGEMIRSGLPAISVLFLAHFINKRKCEFQPFVLLQIVFCTGAMALPIIFSRFINYTFLFVLVAASNEIVLLKLHSKAIRIVQILLVCLFLSTQAIQYRNLYLCWFPYVSIFNEQYIKEREALPREARL